MVLGAAAVIGTSIGMSCRPTVHEKMCVSCCCRVKFNAMGSGNIWHNGVERVIEGKGLVLSTGLPHKVTMVMVTLSASHVEKHVALVLGSFYGFLAVK